MSKHFFEGVFSTDRLGCIDTHCHNVEVGLRQQVNSVNTRIFRDRVASWASVLRISSPLRGTLRAWTFGSGEGSITSPHGPTAGVMGSVKTSAALRSHISDKTGVGLQRRSVYASRLKW